MLNANPLVTYGVPAAALAAGAWYLTRPNSTSPNVAPAPTGCASGTCGTNTGIVDRALLGLTGGAEYLFARLSGRTDDEAILAVYQAETNQDLTDAQRAVALSALAEDDDTLFEETAGNLPSAIGEVVGAGVSGVTQGITQALGPTGTIAAVAVTLGALWVATKAAT